MEYSKRETISAVALGQCVLSGDEGTQSVHLLQLLGDHGTLQSRVRFSNGLRVRGLGPDGGLRRPDGSAPQAEGSAQAVGLHRGLPRKVGFCGVEWGLCPCRRTSPL